MPRKEAPTELDVMAGRRLKAVREAFAEDGPINQALFGSKIGVTRTALANWEAGKLPDVRAMVRLNHWLGIPLEWIYLGQLRHVERDLADRLEQRAAVLGAVVGGPVAEWPMQKERRPGLEGMRPAAAVPRRVFVGKTFHEAPPRLLEDETP